MLAFWHCVDKLFSEFLNSLSWAFKFSSDIQAHKTTVFSVIVFSYITIAPNGDVVKEWLVFADHIYEHKETIKPVQKRKRII